MLKQRQDFRKFGDTLSVQKWNWLLRRKPFKRDVKSCGNFQACDTCTRILCHFPFFQILCKK